MIKFLRDTIFFLVVACSMPYASLGQKEDNIWVMGQFSAININTGTPVFEPGYKTYMLENGSASVSDAAGNLLFYTDGLKVWNKEHILMPNGDELLGNDYVSACQGTVISKFPGSDHLYYIFTVNPEETIPVRYLRAHLVDMELNDGLGDVIMEKKNIILDSMMSEKITVAPDHECGYWIIVYDYMHYAYHSFHLTEEGIDPTPVISYSPPISLEGIDTSRIITGELKVSPDGTKLAHVRLDTSLVEIGTFDNATGAISGILQLQTPNQFWGCSFSPNSQVLYGFPNNVTFHQYDLSGYPDVSEIAASLYSTFDYIAQPTGSRLATNGKIYWPGLPGYIRLLHNPDMLGAACGYDSVSIDLPSGSHLRNGLGNPVVINYHHISSGSLDSLELCLRDSTILSGPDGYEHYLWDNGAGEKENKVFTEGYYWVSYWNDGSCERLVDSFYIDVVICTASVNPDEQLPEFSIYPNPAQDYIYIQRTHRGHAMLEVTDMSGRVVFTQKIGNSQEKIDIGQLSSGNYIFRIGHSKGVFMTKL